MTTDQSTLSLARIIGGATKLPETELGEDIPYVDASPLRSTQRQLGVLLQGGKLDGQAVVIAYLVYSFLDDVFYNITGDIPTSADTSRAQVEFFRSIARTFAELEAAMMAADVENSLVIVSRLVLQFYSTMERLNRS